MIQFLRMLKEVENLADKCECNKCVNKHEKKEKQKTKSIKDELIELINNVDEDKLYKYTPFMFNACVKNDLKSENENGKSIILKILKSCQKDKKLTLEEKLMADGWIKQHFSNLEQEYVTFKEGKVKRNIKYHVYYVKNDMWIFIANYDDKITIMKSGNNVNIPYTENYEIIKKAVELVKSM